MKSKTAITKRLLTLWRSLIDLIAPRACEMCGTRLGINERLICTTCNALLPRTDDASSPYDNHTARRLWGLVPVERCASFVKYHPHTPFAMTMPMSRPNVSCMKQRAIKPSCL